MSDTTTTNHDHSAMPSPRRHEPDAHGQAGLLLAESILHTLLDAKVLTLDQAVDAVQTASEVKVEVAEEMGESRANMRQSISLLAAIGRSLAMDGSGAANED